jgi:hypothetical protein
MPPTEQRPLYLCAGLQSSGSTLVSWCFLQHPGLNGILDARFDALPQLPAQLATKGAASGDAPTTQDGVWCKFTIACFRILDVQQHFADDSWDVRPLLVVRDVRAVFDSLITKEYGRNGTTADDPPLRLRIRRFIRDFELFHRNHWPILIFEQLLASPEAELRRVASALGLPFSPDMLSWPKTPNQIADCAHGNETFLSTRGPDLQSSIHPAPLSLKHTCQDDLDWLEEECAQLNLFCGYPANVRLDLPPGRAVPTFEHTRRYERYQRHNRFSNLFKGIFG